ncbi:zinc-dependent alcohol dehydrogenase [Krasilnikovia sp. M28-CT-15]|uniref:zinc-dependent alcohol dehydrogenase n=1 Tax=Krasilnikovia sp. M28-CT-15 TaxID=3373540 RepID=UPI003876EE51
MKALKFHGAWDVELTEVGTLHATGPDDVVVDVKFCGICGTDLAIVSGAYPVAQRGVTLGHEATGIVAEIGADVSTVRVGDRVVINPTPSCGTCRMCTSGRANHCVNKVGTESGVSYDGAFAGRFRTTSPYVHVLPEHVPLEAAALTEPLSCVLGGVRQLDLTTPSAFTFVFGAGPLGLMYSWALALRGVVPVVIEQSPSRLELAPSRLPSGVRAYASLDEARAKHFHDPACPIDLVVDTTTGLLDELYPQMSCGSTYLSVGLKARQVAIDTMHLADRSLTILGSIDSRDGSFTEAFNLIASGIFPARRLVSDVVPLADFARGFAVLGCDIGRRQMTPAPVGSCKVLLQV